MKQHWTAECLASSGLKTSTMELDQLRSQHCEGLCRLSMDDAELQPVCSCTKTDRRHSADAFCSQQQANWDEAANA